MELRTQMNYVPKTSEQETIEGVSLTTPDMSYTIAEIQAKFANGIAPPIAQNAIYEDEYDETRSFEDLTDATELAVELERKNNLMMKSIKEKEDLKRKARNERLAKFKEWEKQQNIAAMEAKKEGETTPTAE